MKGKCSICGAEFSSLFGYNTLTLNNEDYKVCSSCNKMCSNMLSYSESMSDLYSAALQYMQKIIASSEMEKPVYDYVKGLIEEAENKHSAFIRQNENFGKDESETKFSEHIKYILTTTGYNFEGYTIIKYISVITEPIVLGTGLLSSVSATFSDITGGRSNAYADKLKSAYEQAIKKLKINALSLGGNAIIGIDIDYTSFSGDMIGVIVSGTVVLVKNNHVKK